ncbi:DUF1822 family protein [Lusitaniella coriacea]|uniref:DUF1822 family protein n=1 Tax=Lusitaniella coriacea TaxID=1983105 RepID=UPI003CE6D5D4
MITITEEQLMFTVPLTLEAHKIAQQFYRHQSRADKAKQVYLNTLAVYAANYYLQCLGFKTNIEAGDSWNPLLQTLSDTADLIVTDWGKLECRPVLPDAEVCHIPPEAWEDRRGYLAVQFNRELTEAKILGFIPETNREIVSLSQFRSLEALIDHLHEPSRQSAPVRLSQWLQGIVDAGWETLDTLLQPQHPELAFNFRSNGVRDRAKVIQRGKLLHFENARQQVALLVSIHPPNESEVQIVVEVCSIDEQTHLPPNLQLMILDENGEAVMHAISRSTPSIQLEFSGEIGESFAVKVMLDDDYLLEPFAI